MKSKQQERLQRGLKSGTAMTPISIRVPDHMLDTLKEIATAKDFSGYQGLIRLYISNGMRADLKELDNVKIDALVKSLEKDGVAAEIIEKALAAA